MNTNWTNLFTPSFKEDLYRKIDNSESPKTKYDHTRGKIIGEISELEVKMGLTMDPYEEPKIKKSFEVHQQKYVDLRFTYAVWKTLFYIFLIQTKIKKII
ncbi:MAG: hypothetical protein H0V82_12930 [Candidatus Protochlamydia sp.]|nr:hypothetical protein [Candidatus Protochlamydia sp.]